MNRIYSLVAEGVLTTVMPGCFTGAADFARLDPWARFVLQGRAFALTRQAFLTGWAATVVHGLPTIGKPPTRPTAMRIKAPGLGPQTLEYGRIVVAQLPKSHQYTQRDLFLVSRAWAVADVVRTSRLPDSLVVADAAARRGTDLDAVATLMKGWPGVHKLRWVAKYANANAETPLESLGRFPFLEHDFPLPIANAWVGRDKPEWRVDGLLPWHWWAQEGDGAMKYDNRPDASKIVYDQIDREYELRRLGLDVLRYSWSDVYPDRRGFASKVAAMFREHPARREPIRWWKHVPGVGAVEPRREDWPSRNPAKIILPVGWQNDLRTGD